MLGVSIDYFMYATREVSTYLFNVI